MQVRQISLFRPHLIRSDARFRLSHCHSLIHFDSVRKKARLHFSHFLAWHWRSLTLASWIMSSTTAENAAQLRFPPNVQYNASKIYTVKFLSSCFAGAVAGVLGLQNWLGFALFILATLLTSACLYVKCKARPAKYVAGGLWELVNPGQENIFSFVLVWTLFYGAYASSTTYKFAS